MKTNQKDLLLEQLKKTPVVQFACEKSGVSRATYYRWKIENKDFKKSAEEAILEGEGFITDMTESQLISLIKDKNFHAIQLWLRHHHPKYNNRIEINATINSPIEQLTPEQEAIIKEAARLAFLPEIVQEDNNNEPRSDIEKSGE
ncbi:MAG: hypothetical protein Q8Q92_04065 [bacterium]|nr:hypothetical protein [bacterium]